MPYYRVLLRGTNVWLPMAEPVWFGLRYRRYEARMGFFTTRFFEAGSPDEAERKALDLVPDEVRAIYANKPEEGFTIFIEEIGELDEAPQDMPGGGFTFFGEGEGDEGHTTPAGD